MATKSKKPTTRRGNNEGSIFKRADGRWAAQVTIGYNEDGKPQRKAIYGKTRAEVAVKMSGLVSDVYKHGYTNTTTDTLETLMRHWLMIYKKPEVSSRTFEKNMTYCRLHIFPEFGQFKLKEITPDMVQTWIARLFDKKNLGLDTVKKCKFILSQFMEYAVDNKHINFNPTYKAVIKARERDKSKEKDYKAIRKEDRILFVQAISTNPFWKALCMTSMFGGLRIGEVLALKWHNIDFESESISVENAITKVVSFDEQGNTTGCKTIIGDTKTVASQRENPLPEILAEALKEYHDKRMYDEAMSHGKISLTAPDDFVFGTETGELRTYYGTRAMFNRYLKKHNLQGKNIHFHTLRHTYSNMLFEASENPKVIQALMGHKDVRTTMIYNSIDNRQITAVKRHFKKSDFEM